MFLALITLATSGLAAYYGISHNMRVAVSGRIRSWSDSFAGFFEGLFVVCEEKPVTDVWRHPINSGDATVIAPEIFVAPGFDTLRSGANSCPQVDRVSQWVATNLPMEYQFTLRSQADVDRGATIFDRDDHIQPILDQKRRWADYAPLGGCAIVVGAFEAEDSNYLNSLAKFQHIILLDLWDHSDDNWGCKDIRRSAQRRAALTDTLIRGNQVTQLPLIFAALANKSVPVTYVTIEGDTNPLVFVPSALTSFDSLVVGGVLVLNCHPHEQPGKVSLYGFSRNELLVAATTVLCVLRGHYTLVPGMVYQQSYVAIIKTASPNGATTGMWNCSDSWGSPFGVVLDDLWPSLRPVTPHNLKTVHYLNFFGLGTRWVECCSCQKRVEVDHTADWEMVAQRLLGPCVVIGTNQSTQQEGT